MATYDYGEAVTSKRMSTPTYDVAPGDARPQAARKFEATKWGCKTFAAAGLNVR